MTSGRWSLRACGRAAGAKAAQADEHFTRAIDIQERDGMLVWAARAHLGWAEALAARGEPERSRMDRSSG